jgi:hypothetical protein
MSIARRVNIRIVVQIIAFSLAWSAIEPARAQLCDDLLGNGYIGIYADPGGQQPCIAAPSQTPTTMYVIAMLGGRTAHGVTGVEFRIKVRYPTGWTFQWIANPNLTVSLGCPVDTNPWNSTLSAGCNLAFAECQGLSTQRVYLGSITATNFSGTASPTDLLIMPKMPASFPTLQAPLFTLCDSPVYTAVAMTLTTPELFHEPVAFSATLASIASPLCEPCSFHPDVVAVQPITWAGVKGIFRE